MVNQTIIGCSFRSSTDAGAVGSESGGAEAALYSPATPTLQHSKAASAGSRTIRLDYIRLLTEIRDDRHEHDGPAT